MRGGLREGELRMEMTSGSERCGGRGRGNRLKWTGASSSLQRRCSGLPITLGDGVGRWGGRLACGLLSPTPQPLSPSPPPPQARRERLHNSAAPHLRLPGPPSSLVPPGRARVNVPMVTQGPW